MEAMIFGLCLITSDINIILLLSNRKSLLAVAFSLLSLALTGVTAYFFRRLLLSSGKDAALLGFHQYPAVPILLCLLTLAALAGLVLAIIQLVKKDGKKG